MASETTRSDKCANTVWPGSAQDCFPDQSPDVRGPSGQGTRGMVEGGSSVPMIVSVTLA